MTKTILFSLLAAVISLLPSAYTWAGEPQETLLLEYKLSPAETSVAEKTVIRLSDEKIFTLESYPDREEMKASLGLKLPEKVKEQIIARGGVPVESDPLESYEKMQPAQKQKFQEMRLSFLTNAARILSTTKFALGAGSLVGDGFSFITVKAKSLIGKKGEVAAREKLSFAARSDQAVLSVLKGIDYKLWSQAPLVIDSNEFGVSASIGIVAETGVMKKGAGGAEEVGFSLAFNKTQKAFVFEIFHNSEKFDNTKAAVSVIGVVGKAGMTMGHREGAETIRGSSFYPPAVPGYSMSSPEVFSAGASSSLGFPPPPLADLLTFTNQFQRQALLRVTVSPLVKGYVRIHVGDVKGSAKLIGMRFVDIYSVIAQKIRLKRQPMLCEGAFG